MSGYPDDAQPIHALRDDNPPHQSQQDAALRTQGHSALNSDRPADLQPTPAGGVARGGQEDLSKGKPSLLDKASGKIDKVIGKVTGNPEKREAGELREAGGK